MRRIFVVVAVMQALAACATAPPPPPESAQSVDYAQELKTVHRTSSCQPPIVGPDTNPAHVYNTAVTTCY